MPDPWYDEVDYADSRLRNTIVGSQRLGPVSVETIAKTKEGLTCLVTPIASGQVQEATLAELDMTPLPLGFVTVNNTASFLYRVPARRYKQGLYTQVLRMAHNQFRLPNSLVHFKPLLQTVNNTYPDLDDAITMTEDMFDAVAVSRDAALLASGKVLWRTTYDTVGKINWDNGVITLDDKYKFLSDIMTLKFGANRVR